MKNNNIFFLVIAIFLSGFAQAQEYKIAKSSGRLELNVGRVTVEGHDGNEIIFTSENGSVVKDERAKGLRALNSLGLDDNTGLGIHVTDKGDIVEVQQLNKTKNIDLKVLVPKGVIVAFTHDSQYGGTARFVNLTNEIEVSAVYNNVILENVTGPLTIKTTYGNVTADFSASIQDAVSIVSIYGFVDATLPQATKANLKLSTSYGAIFVAPEFDIKIASTDGMKVYSDKITGTINGGGVTIDLKCNYGKIYLRKK